MLAWDMGEDMAVMYDDMAPEVRARFDKKMRNSFMLARYELHLALDDLKDSVIKAMYLEWQSEQILRFLRWRPWSKRT